MLFRNFKWEKQLSGGWNFTCIEMHLLGPFFSPWPIWMKSLTENRFWQNFCVSVNLLCDFYVWCFVIVLNTFGSSQFPKIQFIVLRNTKQFVLLDELQESCLSKECSLCFKWTYNCFPKAGEKYFSISEDHVTSVH